MTEEEPPKETIEKDETKNDPVQAEQDTDEDEDQLVIDETPAETSFETPMDTSQSETSKTSETSTENVPVPRKTRGRPKKANVVPKEPMEDKVDLVIKEEPKEDLDDILKPKTRMQLSRMGPKSKTWFPNASDRTGSSLTGKSKNLETVLKLTVTTVKREPKEPDMKVFAVSESVVIPDAFLDEKVRSKASDFKLDLGLDKLTGFFGKIKNLDQPEKPAKASSQEPTPKAVKVWTLLIASILSTS